MPDPKVQFYTDPVTLATKVLFEQQIASTKVAMSQDCCCDGNISLPGYGIYARDCCTGLVHEPKVYIDLENPPDWLFTDTFKFSSEMGTPGNCFFFHTGDVTPGVAFLLPTVDGSATILIPNNATFTRISGGCDTAECGCKCCNDWQDDPEDPDAGSRAEYSGVGRYWFMFEGVTICADTFDCVATPLTDPVTFGPVWSKTENFDPPTGPYTSTNAGALYSDNACTPLRAEINVTTKYYRDAGCSVGAAIANVVDQLSVTPTVASVTARGDRTNKVFDDPSGHPLDLCFEPMTFTNVGVCGVDLGYGGTCTLYPCCPAEDAGV